MNFYCYIHGEKGGWYGADKPEDAKEAARVAYNALSEEDRKRHHVGGCFTREVALMVDDKRGL